MGDMDGVDEKNKRLEEISRDFYGSIVHLKEGKRELVKPYLAAVDAVRLFNELGKVVTAREYGRTYSSMPDAWKLAEELENQCAAFLVAQDGETGQVIGYAGLLVVADEGYITNVAVFPEYRRQGVAAKLLAVFENFARGNHLAFLTLEVRPSNAAAIALYESFGFKQAGRRKNYYDLPKEDALILTKTYGEAEA